VNREYRSVEDGPTIASNSRDVGGESEKGKKEETLKCGSKVVRTYREQRNKRKAGGGAHREGARGLARGNSRGGGLAQSGPASFLQGGVKGKDFLLELIVGTEMNTRRIAPLRCGGWAYIGIDIALSLPR